MTDFMNKYTLCLLCVKSSETITIIPDSSIVIHACTVNKDALELFQ